MASDTPPFRVGRRSFVGIGTVAVSLVFVFGPIFRRFLHYEEGLIEKDIRGLEKKI